MCELEAGEGEGAFIKPADTMLGFVLSTGRLCVSR